MNDQQQLLDRISQSSEPDWLVTCRDHNAKLGRRHIADAAHRRLLDVEFREAISLKPNASDFEARIEEAVRVYEECLKVKHGRKQAAAYTRRSIRDHGYREALIRTVRKKQSAGLELLAAHDRLDCSYEQIALDFAKSENLPEDVIEQAGRTLERYAARK